MLRHSVAKPYMCHHCGKRFAAKGAIKIHLISKHTTDFKGYTCPLCVSSKVHPTNSKLKTHILRRHGKSSCFCTTCNILFASPEEMQVHTQQIHSTLGFEQLLFKCSHCEYTSAVRSQTEHHQLNHLPENQWPYACSTCGKRFKKKDNCRRHETIHTGEKNHACELCGAKFR